jgi:hypothetical protein
MQQAIAYRGRLPGVYCDPALPRRADDAIRLDVAAFVGFAERGPVDEPQLVEDPSQYATRYGGDLSLAIDDKGVPTYAALPDAVRSFFDNGGRRCYVVRVAGPGVHIVDDIPVRVTSRTPLGDGRAVVGLAATPGPPPPAPASTAPDLVLRAASPGGWARQLAVDVEVVDTVLALVTGADGSVDLTAATRHLIDEGDAILVRRSPAGPLDVADWALLWAPAPTAPLAPAGGWRVDDVARLLRAELTVRIVTDQGATAVDKIGNLRLGRATGAAGAGRSVSWLDGLQPADGSFRRDRSMYVRAPADVEALVPVLGPTTEPLPEDVVQPAPAPHSRAALEDEGLVRFDPNAGWVSVDPVTLFCDPAFLGQTVESLRLLLERLELVELPQVRGLHTVALVPEVALVALPDLYHRRWTEQAMLRPPESAPTIEPHAEPEREPDDPARFHACEPEPTEPSEPPPAEPPSPAVLRMVVEPPQDYDMAPLLAVAGALVDLAAARADMVALLGLPRHAGLPEAQQLADTVAGHRAATTDVPSYAGVWHPWGALPEGRAPALAPLRPVPPDGAVAGVFAATELTRGWWIEPAGRALAGIVGVDEVDRATTLELFDRGLNVLRRRPGGFEATGAHSLSPDRSLLQLSVRRLLIYVRKLALREGTRLVFEPDDERFRARVAATFTRALERLRVSGALAAYQVVVEPLATRSRADEGKVRIDLKLAPTSPIEFVTVTLLRAGDDLVQVVGP